MDILRTIIQIAILWAFYAIGSFIATTCQLIVPGSIIGLLLLYITLHFKWIPLQWIQLGSSFLLGFLTLFFIPATVAIINYPEMLTKVGAFLIGSVIISTLIVLTCTGKLTQWLEQSTVKEVIHGNAKSKH